jgi:hypothetical protein
MAGTALISYKFVAYRLAGMSIGSSLSVLFATEGKSADGNGEERATKICAARPR